MSESKPETCCRSCQNENVQMLKAIYAAGSWESVTTTRAGGMAFGSDGSMAMGLGEARSMHSGSSYLAQRLAPPPRPTFTPPRIITVAIVLLMLSGLSWVGSIFMEMNGSGAPARWTAVGFVLAAVLTVPSILRNWAANSRLLAEEIRSWERNVAIWQTLLYCSRCDSISSPSGAVTSVEQFRRTFFV